MAETSKNCVKIVSRETILQYRQYFNATDTVARCNTVILFHVKHFRDVLGGLEVFL